VAATQIRSPLTALLCGLFSVVLACSAFGLLASGRVPTASDDRADWAIVVLVFSVPLAAALATFYYARGRQDHRAVTSRSLAFTGGGAAAYVLLFSGVGVLAGEDFDERDRFSWLGIGLILLVVASVGGVGFYRSDRDEPPDAQQNSD